MVNKKNMTIFLNKTIQHLVEKEIISYVSTKAIINRYSSNPEPILKLINKTKNMDKLYLAIARFFIEENLAKINKLFLYRNCDDNKLKNDIKKYIR